MVKYWKNDPTIGLTVLAPNNGVTQFRSYLNPTATNHEYDTPMETPFGIVMDDVVGVDVATRSNHPVVPK